MRISRQICWKSKGGTTVLLNLRLKYYNLATSKISDNYEHQIENLRSLEQHLLQAKAKALATEEKAIVNIAETKTGLPQGIHALHIVM